MFDNLDVSKYPVGKTKGKHEKNKYMYVFSVTLKVYHL